jgi:membrane associated rhomboid family serine protease
MDSTETTAPVCYRHPDRVTGLACSRCGRSICTECSHDAAVGQLCPDDAAQTDRHRVIRARTLYERPSFQTSPVSFTIMGVTVAIFVIGLASVAADAWLFRNLAQFNALVTVGEWWRIFTAALLHANFIHIGFNMYALYLFGPRLEQQVGSPAFASLYVAAAATGGLVSYLLGDPNQISIGASGAIFGLFGAWLVASWKMRHTPGGKRMFNQLFVLLAINVALGFMPGIDWRAHMGGLAAGVAIAYLWSVFAVGKPNAVAIRTAIAVSFIAADLALVLLL